MVIALFKVVRAAIAYAGAEVARLADRRKTAGGEAE
jgi:hypothetical protein